MVVRRLIKWMKNSLGYIRENWKKWVEFDLKCTVRFFSTSRNVINRCKKK